MSEDTKTELKLPAAYKRPSVEQYTAEGYNPEGYEEYFNKHELRLAEAYASGEVTDAMFEEISDMDEMADEDHDGLPDILHVKSQVRAIGNRTLRARHPTRHRFKQYLFGDPSKRLVRKRVLRVPASDVRAHLDELLEKEAAGILSVHAPNGQRIDLTALKAGRVVLDAAPHAAPLAHPPLDSAANDVPAGENMQQYLGGTFVNDPAAERAMERMTAEKEAEVAKKQPVAPELPASGDPLDPLDPVDPPIPTELEQPPMGVDGNTAPIQPSPSTDTETSVETPTAPGFTGDAPEQQDPVTVEETVEEPTEEHKASKTERHSAKGGHKKGSHK